MSTVNNEPIRNDIDYHKVKEQVKQISLELVNCKDGNGPLITKDILIQKYNYSYKKTPILFEMVFKEYGSIECMKKINMMIDNIINVQDGKKTRHNASIEVGEYLAKEYIFPIVNKN